MELQSLSLPIDRDRLAGLAPSLEPILSRLITPETISLADVIENFPESTEQMADVLEYDDQEGAFNFVQALLTASALSDDLPAPAAISGDLKIPRRPRGRAYVHHGSLSIEGGLHIETPMIVLGDLRVTGRVSDDTDGSRLIVTGDLIAATLSSSAPVWVGGKVEAEAVYLGFRSKLFVGRSVTSNLIVGSTESYGIDGEVQAKHYFPHSDWLKDRSATLGRLEALLLPGLIETEEHGFYLPEKMLERVEKGQPYLRSGV